MDQDLLLVPPGRLGALLSNSRRTLGEDLPSLASKSDGMFDPRQLELIERGQASVNETQLRLIAELYQVGAGRIIPSRSHLVIDLDNQQLSAGNHSLTFANNSDSEVLEQYLALLYLLRETKPGTELTLRQPDLETLEEALRKSVDDIEDDLFRLMTQSIVEERTRWLSQRLVVPSAGLLVGLTAIGSVVMINGPENVLRTTSNDTGITQIAEQATAATVNIQGVSAPAAPTTIQTPATSQAATSNSETAAVAGSPALVGAQAEQLIDYDYASLLPGWEIEFRGDRDGYRGLTFVNEKRIEIYVDPGESAESVAGILAHEVGHAIDVEYLSTAERNRWTQARNLPSAWWPGNGLSDFHVGAGDFAEAVAKLLADSPSDSHHGEFTTEQLELARELLP